jgi:hypothetical protein
MNELEFFTNAISEGASVASIVAAAESLLRSDIELCGPPSPRLVKLLIESGTSIHGSLIDLVRAWSRLDMSGALLDALPHAATADQREQVAWLLKTALAMEHSDRAIEIVLDNDEPSQVRRWLLEGLERLVREGVVDVQRLVPIVSLLAAAQEPTLRAALPSFVGALPWSAASASALALLLEDDDHEVVSAAAETLAWHPDAVLTLDSRLLDRLRTHPNPMMQRSAMVLEGALRAAKG